jgi:hypothetical protein
MVVRQKSPAANFRSIISDMDPLTAIAERRIQEAIERGEEKLSRGG